MRYKIITLLVLVFNLYSFAQQDIQENKKNQNINTKIKKTFEIKLESNITTGFKWVLESDYDSTIVKLQSSRYIDPNSKLMGAGGTEVWKFKSLKKGTTELTFKYLRPWEKDQKPEKEKHITVKVK
jgi:predicted secreted protein